MDKDLVTTRTGVGAAIGGVFGFMFAGPIGAGIGALVGGGVARTTADTQKGQLTPRRKLIFSRAMESIKDPIELQKLADAFHGEDLTVEAEALHKRALLRKLPTDAKEKRKAAFRKAMASDNPDLISAVGDAFQGEGALDAAKALKDHADAVRAAHMAGKSAKPMTGGSQEQFATKLAKAIIHFGPNSKQAVAAAGNLVQARGKTPTKQLVVEVIRVAAEALKVDAPAAEGAPENPIVIEEAPQEVDATPVEGAAEAVEATASSESPETGASAPESVTGDSSSKTVEPEVVSQGVAIESGNPTMDHAEAVAAGAMAAESTEG